MVDDNTSKVPVYSPSEDSKNWTTDKEMFHFAIEFKTKKPLEEEFILTDSESEDDVLNSIEEELQKKMLVSPDYHLFSDLSLKMDNCVANGDVKILIIEDGDGPLVPKDAEVTLHYAAYWEKARLPFDSTITSNEGEPKTYCLGRGELLPGLEIGLTSVHGPSARFILLLQPTVSWGLRGILPRIRHEPALFIINLFEVRESQIAQGYRKMPEEDLWKYEVVMKTAEALHLEAKNQFAKKEFKKCIKQYQQSISVLMDCVPKNDEEEARIRKLKVKTFINLAVCFYKIQKPKHVIYMCKSLKKVTDIDEHCKALFYYGRAFEMQGKYIDAMKYFKKALKLEPNNTNIRNALTAVDAKIKQSLQKEKEMWQSAFKQNKEEKLMYNVDETFKKLAIDICADLAERDEYVKIELTVGMTKDEINCIKDVAKDYDGVHVREEEKRFRNKVSIYKLPKL